MKRLLGAMDSTMDALERFVRGLGSVLFGFVLGAMFMATIFVVAQSSPRVGEWVDVDPPPWAPEGTRCAVLAFGRTGEGLPVGGFCTPPDTAAHVPDPELLP